MSYFFLIDIEIFVIGILFRGGWWGVWSTSKKTDRLGDQFNTEMEYQLKIYVQMYISNIYFAVTVSSTNEKFKNCHNIGYNTLIP